jgi:cytochrome c biogenesis protein CcmG/thiol:disulfide interchange protein DsbE
MMFVSLGIGTVIAIALITVVSLLTGGSKGTSSSTTVPPAALDGTKIAGFSLPGLNGGTVKTPWTTTKPHATVLLFFASWCGPCQGEFPRVAKYVKTVNPVTATVVGIDANDENAAAKRFVAKAGATFSIGVDANGTLTSGTFLFGTLPETVFLNQSGVVKEVIYGAVSNAQLTAGIAALQKV